MLKLSAFIDDVRFDAHDVGVRVRRSQAARVMLADPRVYFSMVLQKLEGFRLPSREEQFYQREEDVQAGLTMLLADLGHALRTEVPMQLPYGERDVWIEWGQRVMTEFGL